MRVGEFNKPEAVQRTKLSNGLEPVSVTPLTRNPHNPEDKQMVDPSFFNKTIRAQTGHNALKLSKGISDSTETGGITNEKLDRLLDKLDNISDDIKRQNQLLSRLKIHSTLEVDGKQMARNVSDNLGRKQYGYH